MEHKNILLVSHIFILVLLGACSKQDSITGTAQTRVTTSNANETLSDEKDTPSPLPECPSGQLRNQNGICEFPACPNQQVRNTNGVCEFLPCPKGQFRNQNNVCEFPPCPSQQVRNTNGVCEYLPCPKGQSRNQFGVCEFPPCPSQQVRNANGVCEYLPCPTGQSRNQNNVCEFPPCPSQQVRNANGVCEFLPCPSGQLRNPFGVCEFPACPSQQVRNTLGVCEFIPCPNGMVRNASGVCITAIQKQEIKVTELTRNSPPPHLFFVIDNSGSMEDNTEKLKNALLVLKDELKQAQINPIYHFVTMDAVRERLTGFGSGPISHTQMLIEFKDGLALIPPNHINRTRYFSNIYQQGSTALHIDNFGDWTQGLTPLLAPKAFSEEWGLITAFDFLSSTRSNGTGSANFDVPVDAQVEFIMLSDENNDTRELSTKAYTSIDSVSMPKPMHLAAYEPYHYEGTITGNTAPPACLKNRNYQYNALCATAEAAADPNFSSYAYLYPAYYKYYCKQTQPEARNYFSNSNETATTTADVMDCDVYKAYCPRTVTTIVDGVTLTQTVDDGGYNTSYVNNPNCSAKTDSVTQNIKGIPLPTYNLLISKSYIKGACIRRTITTQKTCSRAVEQPFTAVYNTNGKLSNITKSACTIGQLVPTKPGNLVSICLDSEVPTFTPPSGITFTDTVATSTSRSANFTLEVGFHPSPATLAQKAAPFLIITTPESRMASFSIAPSANSPAPIAFSNDANGFDAAMKKLHPNINYRFHSIVNQDGNQCPGVSNGGDFSKGTHYIDLSIKTGGIRSNICNPNFLGFKDQIKSVIIRTLVRSYTLALASGKQIRAVIRNSDGAVLRQGIDYNILNQNTVVFLPAYTQLTVNETYAVEAQ